MGKGSLDVKKRAKADTWKGILSIWDKYILEWRIGSRKERSKGEDHSSLTWGRSPSILKLLGRA
jgi:hypothetical protein